MGTWGPGSFENDAAIEWFFRVEEAVDPGTPIADALDDALAEADVLESEAAREAVAAAELLASCAGRPPEILADRIRAWTDTHPHAPHDTEVQLAVEALERIREESELREAWDEAEESGDDAWLGALDDLIARLRRAGQGNPATLTP